MNYDLISCGLGDHVLAGTDAAELRPQDAVFAIDAGDGTGWHRCLRCHAWLVRPRPERPARRFPPERDEIELPLRGRALRDAFVLRLIAIDRALHFLLLGVLSAGIFFFLSHRAQLHGDFYRVVVAIHGALGGPTSNAHSTILADLRRAFALHERTLYVLGVLAAAYALLEGVEAVGLWLRRRWAEYLTFVATTILLAPEIYELTGRISVFKVLALVINVAVVVYLLFAKRLFGLRGGGAADEAERERDSGWGAIEATAPPAPVPRPV